jgi:hypothetical protein
MWADQDGVDRQALAKTRMHRGKRLRCHQPVADVGLVGHDDDQEANRFELSRLWGAIMRSG